jgi:2-dehydropantoate 2-reductase
MQKVDSDPAFTALDSPRGLTACIFGAGSIGCHVAFCLQKAGVETYIVARGDNLKALQNNGLHINICGEKHHTYNIHAVADAAEIGKPVDYLFLTVKTYSLSSIVDKVSPVIGPDTTILPPTTSLPFWWFHKMGSDLGGLDPEAVAQFNDLVDPGQQLANVLPPDQCIGFTMWLSAVQEGPGRVHVKHVQRGYPIGELDGKPSARVTRLCDALEAGGIMAPRGLNIRSEIFIKAVNSLCFNTVAVLTGAVNGLIADDSDAPAVIKTMMLELEQLAGAMELPVLQSADARIKQTLASRAHTMSMLHDMKIGKPLEANDLWISFQALAEVTGISLPVSKSLIGLIRLRSRVALQELPEPELAFSSKQSVTNIDSVTAQGAAKF